jgi:hypothetical protein
MKRKQSKKPLSTLWVPTCQISIQQRRFSDTYVKAKTTMLLDSSTEIVRVSAEANRLSDSLGGEMMVVPAPLILWGGCDDPGTIRSVHDITVGCQTSQAIRWQLQLTWRCPTSVADLLRCSRHMILEWSSLYLWHTDLCKVLLLKALLTSTLAQD